MAQRVLQHRDELYRYFVEQSAVGPVVPSKKWSRTSLEERRENWVIQTAWAPMHRNTMDRATSCLPRPLHPRMDAPPTGFPYCVSKAAPKATFAAPG